MPASYPREPAFQFHSGSIHQEAEDGGQFLFHVFAGHDAVAEPVFEEELAPLEPLRQIAFHDLLDDDRAGEADAGFRFRKVNIAEHGERSGRAAGCRIGQNNNVRQFRPGEHPDGG